MGLYLLIGGERDRRIVLKALLGDAGVTVVESENAQSAIALLRDAAFDGVIVSDEARQLALRGLLGQLRRNAPETKVLILLQATSQEQELRTISPEATFVAAGTPPEDVAAMINGGAPRAHPQPPPLPMERQPHPTLELEPVLELEPAVELEPEGEAELEEVEAEVDPEPTTDPPPMAPIERGEPIERSKIWSLFSGRAGNESLAIIELSEIQEGESAETFLRLGNLSARLEHPTLPRIAGTGSSPRPFVAAVVPEGTTLLQLRRKLYDADRWPSAAAATFIAAELAAALEQIHDAKMVHGGLSPRWIWFGRDGSIVLLGAGVANICTSIEESLRTSAGLPTPNPYLAPEQVNDGTADSKSDLFVLGALLHELLTGDPLFLRDDAFHTFDAINACKVPELDRSVPGPIDEICRSCLQRDPDARPRSAAAVRSALRSALEGHAAPPAEKKGLIGKLLGKTRPSGPPPGGKDPRGELAELMKLV